ncbi:MAG: hypothetical protein JJ896_16940 [Rhodothermales bacterium]|nr:hypothetical protein [Rhodothermales bacterium]MBO6781346.1 hypothetical protein [Rhodothermales bacterium]
MKAFRTIPALLALAVAFSGCVFEESVGPPGPTGPPGPAGNANVFTLNFDFLLADAAFNGDVASVQYDVDDITVNVVDEGAVLLFFRDQGTWTAMPYTFYTPGGNPVSFNFGYEVGFLEVFYESPSANLANLPDREMKAVIIDGFPAFKAGIDLTDYDAVARYFGLED